MRYDLARSDLISPYLLRGEAFGGWHAARSSLYVRAYTVTMDDEGIVIRGNAGFDAQVTPHIGLSTMTFGIDAENSEGHPASDPGRRHPWIDIRDAHFDIELCAQRAVSQKVAAAILRAHPIDDPVPLSLRPRHGGPLLLPGGASEEHLRRLASGRRERSGDHH